MTSAEAGPAEILNNTAIIAATVNNKTMRLIKQHLLFFQGHKGKKPCTRVDLV